MSVRYQRAVDLVELTGILQTTVTGLSIDEIAGRFEVSRRTAERMLGALRDRFPDLQPVFRGGRKYWKLSPTSRARPIQLPKTLEILSERIVELEAQISAARSSNEALQGIADGVLGTSPVGLIVLDPEFRVVWANDAIGRYTGLPTADWIGRDARGLLREHAHEVFEDADGFVDRLLATYRDNTYIENFECHVLERPGRQERWLEHWSRPIPKGRYAGGRIDHYVDITSRVRTDVPSRGHPPAEQVDQVERRAPSGTGLLPENSMPVLRSYLATIQEAASAALQDSAAAPALRQRLTQVVQSTSETIGSALDVLQHGQTKVEPLSAPVVFRTVYALVRSAAEERQIQVSVNADPSLPPVAQDRAMVVSCLAGAVRNSIESLEPGSRIELRAELLQQPERLRISVLDDGPGMPEAFGDLDGPFIPTQRGGIGLGITLVRDQAGRPNGIAQYFDALTWTDDRENQD